ncbi:unannotated protein [freshwater metagenome]|uniref:Unannotated protein n=1 Tax=freshwater metagenome TaxID=449393 RepID=A0A6J6Z3B1_9ZZZZ
MAERDRLARDPANHVCRSQLMRRVAHTELRRHGKRFDRTGDRGNLVGQTLQVERRDLGPVRIVATHQNDRRIVAERLAEACTFEHFTVEADDHRTDRAAFPLHQRVRRQRGGQRDQLNPLGEYTRRLQHRIDRPANADGQIVMRRWRFGRGNDRAVVFVEHDGIGVGTAGVDTEEHPHTLQRWHGRPRVGQARAITQGTTAGTRPSVRG